MISNLWRKCGLQDYLLDHNWHQILPTAIQQPLNCHHTNLESLGKMSCDLIRSYQVTNATHNIHIRPPETYWIATFISLYVCSFCSLKSVLCPNQGSCLSFTSRLQDLEEMRRQKAVRSPMPWEAGGLAANWCHTPNLQMLRRQALQTQLMISWNLWHDAPWAQGIHLRGTTIERQLCHMMGDLRSLGWQPRPAHRHLTHFHLKVYRMELVWGQPSHSADRAFAARIESGCKIGQVVLELCIDMCLNWEVHLFKGIHEAFEFPLHGQYQEVVALQSCLNWFVLKSNFLWIHSRNAGLLLLHFCSCKGLPNPHICWSLWRKQPLTHRLQEAQEIFCNLLHRWVIIRTPGCSSPAIDIPEQPGTGHGKILHWHNVFLFQDHLSAVSILVPKETCLMLSG